MKVIKCSLCMVNYCFDTDFFLCFCCTVLTWMKNHRFQNYFMLYCFEGGQYVLVKADREPDGKNDFCWEILKALTSDPLSSHNSVVISRPYTVVLGADTLSGNEPTKQEFRTIRSIPHPSYNGHANDIMLLKVLTCCLLHFVTFTSRNPSSLSLQLCRIK